MKRSEILQNIRNRIGEKNLFGGNLCKKRQCSVDLTGVSESDRVVVDLDEVFPHGQEGEKQCDCILFYFNDMGNFIVVLMELKGGKDAEAPKAVQQLKAGADFAARYTPSDLKSICYPILFHNGLSKMQTKRLKKNQSKVRFKGKSFEIKTERCGGKLADVIS